MKLHRGAEKCSNGTSGVSKGTEGRKEGQASLKNELISKGVTGRWGKRK